MIDFGAGSILILALEGTMGAFRDYFAAEVEGHTIEFEAYTAGLFSYGCSLFVDNKRVDSVGRYSIFFSYFNAVHKVLGKTRGYKGGGRV